MIHLAPRTHLSAVAALEEKGAHALLREVVRHWASGRAAIDLAAVLKRLQNGEPVEQSRKAVCL